MEMVSSPSRQLIPYSHPPGDSSHFYVIGPGNNKNIVEEVLSKREGWLPTGIYVAIKEVQSTISGGNRLVLNFITCQLLTGR